MALGDIYEGNPRSWTDGETNRTIIQPIAEDLNRHMYFTSTAHTWGMMNVDGTEEENWHCVPEGKQAGHSIISFDGTMIAAGGNGYISLVKRNPDKTAEFIPLAAHKSSMSGNFVHPHPSFSMDDRYILFATDFGGKDRGKIYLVDLRE